jgi:hypothetical protein
MNERTLRRLFRSIVLTSGTLPITAGLVACGGSSENDDGFGNGSGASAGTTSSGGSSSSGGNTTGGSTSSGGSTTGGSSSSGGNATGGSTSSGGSTSGGAGGSDGGSGGSGGTTNATCMGPPSDCFNTTTVTLPRSCLADPAAVPPTSEECVTFCNSTSSGLYGGCALESYDEENIVITCYSCAAVGRRFAGFEGGACDERTLGAQLANMALLEAVSVHAFRDLRSELAGFGAPRGLLRGMSRAARDEVRHARRTRALARRFGAKLAPVPRPSAASRSLEDIARENAVEGCVRETFGALVAHYQSEHAKDPELRGALSRIARDETRHAALSWQLHAWLERRLDRAARQRVKQAQEAAARKLYAELATPGADDPENLAGFPAPETSRALFQKACPALWA